jgi:hypothetical protein
MFKQFTLGIEEEFQIVDLLLRRTAFGRGFLLMFFLLA